jgi:hypothetical protein
MLLGPKDQKENKITGKGKALVWWLNQNQHIASQ